MERQKKALKKAKEDREKQQLKVENKALQDTINFAQKVLKRIKGS